MFSTLQILANRVTPEVDLGAGNLRMKVLWLCALNDRATIFPTRCRLDQANVPQVAHIKKTQGEIPAVTEYSQERPEGEPQHAEHNRSYNRILVAGRRL